MVTVNTTLTQDESLRATTVAMPSTTLTIELQVGLPANWEAGHQSVALAQYGTGSVSASGFAITTWVDYLDVYIAGRQFNTTIAMSELIGQTRRLSFTWDSTTGTAKSYLDGTLVDTAIVATGRTIASGQSFTLGAGAADEVLPRATFGDVRIFDVVRSDVEIAATAATTLSGSEAGLVGYWTPTANTLTSTLGDANFTLQQQALAMTDRGSLTLGAPRHGTIAAADAHDTYTVELVAGETYTFAAVGIGGSSLTDTYLRLADPSGTIIASDNDTLPNQFSKITFTATISGSYTLDVYGALQRTGDYGISATLGSKATFDVDMGGGVMDSHSTWTDTRGTGVTVTYGFQVNDPGERTNFAEFSEAQKAATREILALYADVSGLTFVEVAPSVDPVTGLLVDTAQMLMSNYSQSDGSGGHAHYPRDGDIHINTAPLATLSRGSYAWYTMLHEIGHALGLSHPGDYGGPGGYAAIAQFITDTTQFTNLSYWDAENSGGDLGGYGDTPLLFDVLAIQNLYGVNTATRTGDTTYGFNANAGRDVYDFTINTQPGVTIWDAAGIDTLDLSASTANQQINLVSGEFSDVLGLSNNLTIAMGATVENAIGGRGNDTISGNDAANILTGNDGNDGLRGGLGADTLEGGRGADSLDGGDGADRLVGDGSGLITDPAIYGLTLNSGTGVNQSLRRTGITDLPTTAMTFEFDVKFAAAPANQWFFDFPGLSLLIDPSNSGAPGIWVLVDGSWTYSSISVSQLGDGNSHRVSFTWDSATGAYAHYLDGTEVKSGTGFKTGAVLGGSGNLTIDQVNGSIGDVRIYDRALSAAEIFATTNVVIPDPTTVAGLVLNWRVDSDGAVTDARGGPAPTVNAGTGTAPVADVLIAETTFADLLSGGAGDDTLLGAQGNDTLEGGTGADSLNGGDGADVVNGDDGDDLITSEAGPDTIDGGAGNDTLTVAPIGTGRHVVSGGAGRDRFVGDFSAYTTEVTAGAERVDVTVTGHFIHTAPSTSGTGFDFEAVTDATVEDLTFIGGSADDFLSGHLGNDVLRGNGGNDRLASYEGNDLLDGGAGNDNLGGGLDNDTLEGGAGNDTLNGSTGVDRAIGGAGDDLFLVENTADAVLESVGGGKDTVVAYVSYVLAAGSEIEILRTANANGTEAIDFYGNEFNNTLLGNAGANRLTGGAGNDTYVVNIQGDVVVDTAGGGIDTINTTVSYALNASEIELLRVLDPATTTAIDLVGNGFNNTLMGNAGVNRLFGNAGNDTIHAYDGNDTLEGGFGADRLYGGKGDDAYYVETSVDLIYETIGEGIDTIFTTLSYSLTPSSEVEILRTTNPLGTSSIVLNGNSLANTLMGNAGVNRLFGAAANDILYGLDGNDTLDGGTGSDNLVGGKGHDNFYVDSASDLAIEVAGEGTDMVYAAVSYTLGATSEIEVLRAFDPNAALLSLTGNGLANTLIGSSGANTLTGADGDDILSGLDGSDRLLGGNGADRLYGGLGVDTLTGGGGVDHLYFDSAFGGGNVDSVTDFAAGEDALWLSSSVFDALSAGALPADAFMIGTATTDALHRIVYNSATGALLYDADGSGSAASVQFATLSTGLALTSASFIVF